ncbi:tetratricopeptide repeat protein [Palleronia caenipelagi]|nr:tetratricopeptide repeat protein [Palleronia caenipelagi]
MSKSDLPDRGSGCISTGDIGGDFVRGGKTSFFSSSKTVNIYESAESYKRGQEDKARELDARITELERAWAEALRQEGAASGKAELLQEQLTEAKSAKEAVEANLANVQASYEAALERIEDLQRQLAELGDSVPTEFIAEIEAALQASDLNRAEELIAPLLNRPAIEDMIAEQARLYHLAGEIAAERFDYGAARARYVRAAELAPESFDDQIAASNMAQIAGAYHQAEHFARSALALVGEDSTQELDRIRAEMVLASALTAQGRYDAALPLFGRALESSERVLDAEHPDTLSSVNNLAYLYRAQGRYDAAEPLYERALESRERVLGPEHPDTLTSVNNLACLYESQGRYDEAGPLYERALESRERVLGPEHPDTLGSVNNLACLYESQGRYDAAEPLYERALESSERVLGAEHPQTLISVNSLAYLYQAQGRYDAAEPLYERALESRERVLGAEHPQTLSSVNNLAALYDAQGRYDEALPLYERALESRERILGAEHPDTLSSVNNLAVLYESQGRYDAALPLYERAATVDVSRYGPDIPMIRTFARNYLRLLDQTGQPEKAQDFIARHFGGSDPRD